MISQAESVYKLVYLDSERREGGGIGNFQAFAEAEEDIEVLFEARHPATQSLIQQTRCFLSPTLVLHEIKTLTVQYPVVRLMMDTLINVKESV